MTSALTGQCEPVPRCGTPHVLSPSLRIDTSNPIGAQVVIQGRPNPWKTDAGTGMSLGLRLRLKPSQAPQRGVSPFPSLWDVDLRRSEGCRKGNFVCAGLLPAGEKVPVGRMSGRIGLGLGIKPTLY